MKEYNVKVDPSIGRAMFHLQIIPPEPEVYREQGKSYVHFSDKGALEKPWVDCMV
jgi:hypothetical protein